MDKILGADGMSQAHRQFFTVAGAVIAAFTLSAFAPEVMAQAVQIPTSGKTVGTLSQNITASLRDAGVLVVAIAYLGALIFGWMALMKWKAHGEQPDRTPLKVPITYMLIAAGCAALPEVLGTGISTLWGGGAQVIQQP